MVIDGERRDVIGRIPHKTLSNNIRRSVGMGAIVIAASDAVARHIWSEDEVYWSEDEV